MELTVLFWNYNSERGDTRRRLSSDVEKAELLARLAQCHSADVIVLTECTVDEQVLLAALQVVDAGYELPLNPHERFRFFTRFPGSYLKPSHGDDRVSVRRLQMSGHTEILLAAIHYLDRRNHSKDRQWREIGGHKKTVQEAEEHAGHDRTLLFGDLNMNPFDLGMVDPRFGLGAVMTRDIAEVQHSRMRRPCFYNPMWSLMGKPDAPGSFYWNSREPSNPYWNCLDGVLIRPSLLRSIRDEDIRIVRWIETESGRLDLIRLAAIHWKIAHSDHLPLVFRFTVPAAPTHQEVSNDSRIIIGAG
jgi:hypothetical protein